MRTDLKWYLYWFQNSLKAYIFINHRDALHSDIQSFLRWFDDEFDIRHKAANNKPISTKFYEFYFKLLNYTMLL